MSPGWQEVVPIDPTDTTPHNARLTGALSAEEPSIRLKAALAAGTSADPGLLDTLVERCAVEPDFFVRDMLSWALTRLPSEPTLARVRRELGAARAQARSQALHTLSKIGDKGVWPSIPRALLHDADDEVARTAWRVMVALAPEDETARADLAGELVRQLGRGDRAVRLSLSRALVDLGEATRTALERAAADPDPAVATHAAATEVLRERPEAGFDAAVDEARRIVALSRAPEVPPAAQGAGPC
ncbi:HEAT repeat domain-containing protein [Streptomyces nigra]|uniref:HEAT repeat domain-containing protein n=1 Tax=Streptomyces sp. M7 TaxID=255705 RepID=UPI0037D9E86D